MRNKILISILIILIITVVVIGIIVATDKKNMKEPKLFNRDEVKCIEIQYKNELVKLTNHNDIDSICNLFDKTVKRERSLDDEKGWIYRITALDGNNNPINSIYILGDKIITIKKKGYRCNSQILSVIDEISGIQRD